MNQRFRWRETTSLSTTCNCITWRTRWQWNWRSISRRWMVSRRVEPTWMAPQFLLIAFVNPISRSNLPNFCFINTRWKDTVAERTYNSSKTQIIIQNYAGQPNVTAGILFLFPSSYLFWISDSRLFIINIRKATQ